MRSFLFIFMVCGLADVAVAQTPSPEPQIQETLRALPEAMRAEATVIA